jgi:hypothetical protein
MAHMAFIVDRHSTYIEANMTLFDWFKRLYRLGERTV